MYDRLVEIILNRAAELNEDLRNKIPVEEGDKAPLFGGGGVLDSIALVTLISAVEQDVEDAFDVALTIADDRAMSASRSPFRSVGSLAEYLVTLLEESP